MGKKKIDYFNLDHQVTLYNHKKPRFSLFMQKGSPNLYYGCTINGKRIRKVMPPQYSHESLTEAAKAAEQFILNYLRGVMSLSEVIDMALEDMKSDSSGEWHKIQKSRKELVLYYFGDVPVVQIKPSHVKRFVENFLIKERHYSESGANNFLALLSKALQVAEDEDKERDLHERLNFTNPCRSSKVKWGKSNKTGIVYTENEVTNILKEAWKLHLKGDPNHYHKRNMYWAHLYLTLLNLVKRPGSILNLKWSDIIELPSGGAMLIFSDTKVEDEERLIVSPAILQYMLHYKQEAERQKISSLYVVGIQTADRKPGTFRGVWRIIKNRLQLKASSKMYHIRHTKITKMVLAGEDIKTIQKVAGHRTSKTTLDVYAQVGAPKLDTADIDQHLSELIGLNQIAKR